MTKPTVGFIGVGLMGPDMAICGQSSRPRGKPAR